MTVRLGARQAGSTSWKAASMPALGLTACTWQRVPPPPEFPRVAPVPLAVGLVVEDGAAASGEYGPLIAKQLREAGLFRQVTYPYRKGDAVEVEVRLSVSGGWTGSGFAEGICIGATLGVMGALVGPSMKGVHTVVGSFNTLDGVAIAEFTDTVETQVEWGLLADAGEVARAADSLQVQKIALVVGREAVSNRRLLVQTATGTNEELGPSGEHLPGEP